MSPATRPTRLRGEAGVTLVELLIAIILLGIIVVPLTAAMVLGFDASLDTERRLEEARGPLFTSAFFARDGQSADTVDVGGAPACGNAGYANVVTFTWAETPIDGGAAETKTASYATRPDGSKLELVRSFCGTNGQTVAAVAPAVTSATVTCTPASCTENPETVTLNAQMPSGKTFTLQATRRVR